MIQLKAIAQYDAAAEFIRDFIKSKVIIYIDCLVVHPSQKKYLCLHSSSSTNYYELML